MGSADALTPPRANKGSAARRIAFQMDAPQFPAIRDSPAMPKIISRQIW
jgi:hypothetical protein